MERTCVICGKIFEVTKGNQVTCSDECSFKRRRQTQRNHALRTGKFTLKTKICKICGKEFETYRGSQVTCSDECSKLNYTQNILEYAEKNRELIKEKRMKYYYEKERRDKTRISKICVCTVCSKEFETTHKQKYCSDECRKEKAKQYNTKYAKENRLPENETKWRNAMLTEKENEIKEYLIGKVVPSLEELLEEKNSSEFLKWNKNCCSQTAFVCCYILKQELPDYIWEIKENIFKHTDSGTIYNHAFVVGKSKKYGKLLVDLSRHPIWNDWFIKIDSVKKPYESTDIKDEIIKEKKLDFNEMKNIDEYFTKMKGINLVKEVISRASSKD